MFFLQFRSERRKRKENERDTKNRNFSYSYSFFLFPSGHHGGPAKKEIVSGRSMQYVKKNDGASLYAIFLSIVWSLLIFVDDCTKKKKKKKPAAVWDDGISFAVLKSKKSPLFCFFSFFLSA